MLLNPTARGRARSFPLLLQATAAAVESEPADEAAEDMADDKGGGGGVVTRPQILTRAGALLAGGVALCVVFSDPLVESLTNLSRASGVPAFAVGFVLTPLASNSSEFVSSLRFAARKRISNMSLTLAQGEYVL
jgi:Ca2+/H+ antiporter